MIQLIEPFPQFNYFFKESKLILFKLNSLEYNKDISTTITKKCTLKTNRILNYSSNT